MWDMSCENRQPIPLQRVQQVCMLRLTTPHNLKGERAPVALCREPTEAAAETVGSNPAPRKKSRCAYAVRLQARSRHSGLLSLLPLLPPFSRR